MRIVLFGISVLVPEAANCAPAVGSPVVVIDDARNVRDPSSVAASVAKLAKYLDAVEPEASLMVSPVEPEVNVTATFTVLAAHSLKENLSLWCAKYGWTLLWDSEFDYKIVAEASFAADDFVDAIGQLADVMRAQSIPMRFQLGSNDVIRVSGGPVGR